MPIGSSGLLGLGEGSTGHAAGSLSSGAAVSSGAPVSGGAAVKARAAKSKLPASAHPVWKGLSAEAQERRWTGTEHSRHQALGGLAQLQPCWRTSPLQPGGGSRGREVHARPGRGRPPSSRFLQAQGTRRSERPLPTQRLLVQAEEPGARSRRRREDAQNRDVRTGTRIWSDVGI